MTGNAFASRHPQDGYFVGKTVASGTYSIPYAVYLPQGYTAKKQWPVILFLSGVGETGNDGWKQTKNGLGPAIAAHPEWFAAIVVFPQCPDGLRWTSHMNSSDSHSPTVNDLVMTALDQTLQEYSGDSQRVSLTGMSLGGAGAWALAASKPNRFITIVPLCGRVSPALAPKLVNKSIWVFHGAKDDVVPVDQSRAMVNALLADGAKNVRYTELPNLGHPIWDIVYNEAEVISFLLPLSF